MIRRPGVESAVQRARIIEIAVAPIDRQRRRGNVDEAGSRAAALDMIAVARNDDDGLVTEPRAGAEFGFDIGPDATA